MIYSISSIANAVKSGEYSAKHFVERAISQSQDISPYNALISITTARALDQAAKIDQSIADGTPVGKLAGVPFVVKDNFMAFGAPSTAASKMLENYFSPIQSTAVEKLEAEGAICIGKANLDAFAHGGSTESSYFGVTKNSVDKSRVAGGSSGGSAVVTALDVVPFALGTDTGGSIRQPASFNGVYGMKPTYGTVSRYGVVAMASSTDTIGCFAKSAAEVGLVMEIMAGIDEKDMTTLPDFLEIAKPNPKKLKIGLIDQTMTENVDPAVQKDVNNYVSQLEAAGHETASVSLPIFEHTLAMYYIIVPAEISSNLARYDGIRYGLSDRTVKTLAELYSKTRADGFNTENKRRIMIGSYVLSSGFFDAYFLQAQKARTILINDFDKLFDDYDVLVSPTAPSVAFGIGQNTDDPISMYLSDVMVVPASLAGIPAISVPAGADDSGLPIGVQLMAARKNDGLLINLAASMENSNE